MKTNELKKRNQRMAWFLTIMTGIMFTHISNGQSKNEHVMEILNDQLLTVKHEQANRVAIRTEFTIAASEQEVFYEEAKRLSQFTTGKFRPVFYRFFQNAEETDRFILFEEWPDIKDYLDNGYQTYRNKFLTNITTSVLNRSVFYHGISSEHEASNPSDVAELDEFPATAPTAQKTLERLRKVDMEKSPFVLFVDVPIKTEGIRMTRKAVAHVQEETLEEDRVIHYGYFQELESPGSFLLFEWWTTFDGMKDHLDLPHFELLMKTFGAYGGDGRLVGLFRPLEY